MAVLSRLSTTTFHHLSPPLHLATTRSYYTFAAAAVAQPQFDYDSDYSETFPPSPAIPDANSEGSRTLRGVHWLFIGDPYSKKHVYAHMIAKLLNVPHISITTLLRQDLHPRSPLYKQIAEAVNRGKLVPESIIFGLLSKRLEDGQYRGENGFILDGIPRTRLQAEILDQLIDIDLVVNFKFSEDLFWASGSTADPADSQLKTRSSSPYMNKPTENSKPKISAFYKEQMQLLEEYYQDQKKLIDFQVGNAPGETWKGLIAALHLQHINAAHSPRTLWVLEYLEKLTL